MEHSEGNVSVTSNEGKDECQGVLGKNETNAKHDLFITKTLADASGRKNVKSEIANERSASNTITVIAENGKVVSVGSNTCYDDSKNSLRSRKPLMNISQNDRSIAKDVGEILLATKENESVAKDSDENVSPPKGNRSVAKDSEVKRSPAKENRSVVKYTQVIRSAAKNTEEKGSIAKDSREKKRRFLAKDAYENTPLLVADFLDEGFIANIWSVNKSPTAKVNQDVQLAAKDCHENKSVAMDCEKDVAKASQKDKSIATDPQTGMGFATDSQKVMALAMDSQKGMAAMDSQKGVAFATDSQKGVASATDSQKGVACAADSQEKIPIARDSQSKRTVTLNPLSEPYTSVAHTSGKGSNNSGVSFGGSTLLPTSPSCEGYFSPNASPNPNIFNNVFYLDEEYCRQIRNIQQIWANHEIRRGTDIFQGEQPSPHFWHNILLIYKLNGFSPDSKVENVIPMYNANGQYNSTLYANGQNNSTLYANGQNNSTMYANGQNNSCGPNSETMWVTGLPLFANGTNNSQMRADESNNSSFIANGSNNFCAPNSSTAFVVGPPVYAYVPNNSATFANVPNNVSMLANMLANGTNNSAMLANMLANGANNSAMLAKMLANVRNNSSMSANTYKLFPNTTQQQVNPFDSMDFLSRPPPNIVSSVGGAVGGAMGSEANNAGPGVPQGVNGSTGLVGLGVDISMGMKVSMGMNYGAAGMMNCSVGANGSMGLNTSTAPSGMVRSGSMDFNASHGINNNYYGANVGASNAASGLKQNDASSTDGATFNANKSAKEIPSIFDLITNLNASGTGDSSALKGPDNNTGGSLQLKNGDKSWPRIVLKEHIVFGEFGEKPAQFHNPCHLCVTQEGWIVVADTSNHRIQVFGRYGKFMFAFGTSGRGDGELWYPRRVAILRGGNLLVCDCATKRVRLQVFTIHGEYVKKIVLKKSRVDDQLDRQFPASAYRFARTVAGLTTTELGHIVLVDAKITNEPNGNPALYRIDESGTLLNWFDISKHIAEPSNIAAKNGTYYICDFKNHCVGVFAESGQFLTTFGRPNLTDYPNGIDLSPHGYLIVADTNGNRFHACVFTLNGKMVCEYDFPYVKLSKCGGLVVSNGHFVTVSNKLNYGLILKVPPNSF